MNINLSQKQYFLFDQMAISSWTPTPDEFFGDALNKTIENRQRNEWIKWQDTNTGKTSREFYRSQGYDFTSSQILKLVFRDFLDPVIESIIDSRNQRRHARGVKWKEDPYFGIMLPGKGIGALSASPGPEARRALKAKKRLFKQRAVMKRREKMHKLIEEEGKQTKKDLNNRKQVIIHFLREYINEPSTPRDQKRTPQERTYNEIKRDIIEALKANPETVAWKTKEKKKLQKELVDAELELATYTQQKNAAMVQAVGSIVGGLKRMINNIDFQGLYPQEKAMIQHCLEYHVVRTEYDNTYDYNYTDNFRFRMSRRVPKRKISRRVPKRKISCKHKRRTSRKPKRKISRKPKRRTTLLNKLTVKELRKLASEYKIKGRSKMNKDNLIKAVTKECKKRKISFVMHEFKNQKLKARGSRKVTNRKQAIAIALSVANKSCNYDPKKKLKFRLVDNKPKPVDMKLYNTVKAKVYKKIPTHSAYRSGIVVKKYKASFAKKYGSKSPYTGKNSKNEGLGRWFAEDWRNQRGGIGYEKSRDVYRPTKKISPETPVTFKELSKYEIKKAQKEKSRTGRVKRFKKSRKLKKKDMSYCVCKGRNKTKGFTCRQHCKYGRK